MPKNYWKRSKYEFGQFLTVFGRFLSLDWSDWFLVFCICPGTSRHKFRVPTRHTLKKFFRPYEGGSAIFQGARGDEIFMVESWNFFWWLLTHNVMGKGCQLIQNPTFWIFTKYYLYSSYNTKKHRNLGPLIEIFSLNKTEVESVQLELAAEILLLWTNVARTNVMVTVVICCISSQDPLFKVLSQSGQ